MAILQRITSLLRRDRPKTSPETREQFLIRKWRHSAKAAGASLADQELFKCWRLPAERADYATAAQHRAALVANGLHKRIVNMGRSLTDARMEYPDTAGQDDSLSVRERVGTWARTGRRNYTTNSTRRRS